jgi:hypothetical protein
MVNLIQSKFERTKSSEPNILSCMYKNFTLKILSCTYIYSIYTQIKQDNYKGKFQNTEIEQTYNAN